MGYESIRQDAGVDEELRQGGYKGGAWNPLNDMMGDLKRIVGATQPEAVDKAGSAFTNCASNMDTAATLFYDSAKRLADHWQGDAAEAALKKLKELYESCQEIYSAAKPSGAALTAQAGVLRKYKQIVAGAGGANAAGITTAMVILPGGGIVTAAAGNQIFNNNDAQDIMRNLNEDTKTSNDHFPMHMRTDVPLLAEVREAPVTPGPGGPGAGPGVGGGGGAGGFPKSKLPGGASPDFPGGGGSDSNPSIGSFPGGGSGSPGGSGGFPGGQGNLPGSEFPGGGGTGLAGFNPAGGGVGGGLGAGGGGVGGMDPFGSGTGAGGGLNAGAGAGGGIGGVGGFGTGAGAGKGAGNRGMMPMAPHGGQGEEKERERSTWLTEDEDVWNAGDDAAPPVIG